MIEYQFFTPKAPSEISQAERDSIAHLMEQLTKQPCMVTDQDIWLTSRNSFLLVAREGGTIVGMALLCPVFKLAGIEGRIEEVIVDGQFQGRGIGRRLTEMLIERARRGEYRRVELTSNPSRVAANALYRRLGFTQHQTNVYRLDLAE